MAARYKRSDKVEDLSDFIRLQLLYFDEVNEAGHELSKLQHELKISSGAKLIRF